METCELCHRKTTKCFPLDDICACWDCYENKMLGNDEYGESGETRESVG